MSKFQADDVLAEIDRQAPGFGVSPKIAKAFFAAENTADGKLRPGQVVLGTTTSPAGARGVMQTMPKTEAALQRQGWLPAGWKYDPANLSSQVSAGLAAMAEARSRAKNPNDVLELATMYNGSSAAWRAYRAGDMSGIKDETKQYWIKAQTAMGLVPTGPKNTGVPMETQTRSSGSSSTQTTSTGFNAGLLSQFQGLVQSIAGAGGSIDSTIKSVLEFGIQRKGLEQQTAAAIAAEAAAAGDQVAADYAIQAGQAARNSETLRTANLNPLDAGNFFAQATQRIAQSTVDLETRGAEIDKRLSVGFFDNPLEWMVNQVRLPGMVGEYNQVVNSQNRLTQQTKELQALTASQISLTQAVDADAITRAGVAKAATIAGKAQTELAKAQEANAGAAIRDAMTAQQLQGTKADLLYKSLVLTKEQIMEREGLSEKAAQAKVDQFQMDSANNYLKMIGSSTVYDSLLWKSITGTKRQTLVELAGTGKIASNFADTAEILDKMGNLTTMAKGGDLAATNWFRGTVADAEKKTAAALAVRESLATKGGKILTEKERKETRDAALNEIQLQYMGETKDMAAASANNPMRIDFVAVSRLPQLANNGVAQFINRYGPGGAEPVFTTMDPKTLLDRFTAGIVQGVPNATPATAAEDISSFFKQAIEEQAKITKYPLFGLSVPSNYRVIVPKAGFFSGSKQPAGNLDMANKAAVQEYITRGVAMQLMQRNTGAHKTGIMAGPQP